MSHVYDYAMVFVLPARSVTPLGLLPRSLRLLSAAALLLGTLSVTSGAFAKEKGKDTKSDDKTEPKPKTTSKNEDSKDSKDSKDSNKDADSDSAEADNGEEASASASINESSAPGAAGVVRPDGGPAATIMFIDGGLRSDLGLILMRSTIGRLENEEDFDVKAFGPMVHVGILTQFFWKFRIGAALGYGWNYKLVERLTTFEEEEEQEPMEWVLGQVYTADIRLEFSQKLSEKLWLVATPRGGIQAVLVGEDLKSETEGYEDAYNVRQGPQLGLIGGFDLGARYMLADWFSLRLTGGYAYYSQGLLRAKRRGDAADADFLWRLRGARVGGNLAMEANF